MDLLDNEKYIYDNDPHKIIDILNDFPKQFKIAEKIVRESNLGYKKKFKNVLILGIGNSANVAYRLIESININELKLPIIFCSKSTIPLWVNEDTLVIAVSYSGNTAEVVKAVDNVLKLSTGVTVITTGGKLEEKAASNKNIRLIRYEAHIPSRMSVGYIYTLLVGVLYRAGAIHICNAKDSCPLGLDWNDIEDAMFKYSKKLNPSVSTYNNIAKRTAVNLYQNIPVIYGCTKLTEVVSYRLKSQICLSSKNFAHFGTIPEIDHDEIVAWEMRPELRAKYFVVFIIDKKEKEEMKKRLDIIKGIFIEKRIRFEEIALEGKDNSTKVFCGILLADWISIYLAILNKVDPFSTNLLDLVKNRLAQSKIG